MDGSGIGWASVLVSVLSACAAVGATFVTLREGRAMRRNTEFLAHRDQWWQRWSWVTERALSGQTDRRAAAALLADALATRSWTTDDDEWMYDALRWIVRARTGRRDDNDLRSD
ncbi:hypothetical protein ASG04_15760 [Curtobacterium sp. Leaf183]|uniref:hypothetical protein n=1 Tax=Curtobacterium sp. Leaf183 TaxID=1736291 RepID=UPI0006FF213D|nr:hypothetical protein [Curtobacterium sp. Leaf183]KQS06032.1 hypothetical protein ASG04_15760 [Curtobacterium sp. Leaf183]